MASAIRTDAQRWPLLSDAGLDRVRTWRAHPRAPVSYTRCPPNGGMLNNLRWHQVPGAAGLFASPR